MRAIVNLTLLVTIAITLASSSDMSGNYRHRMKRAPQGPGVPVPNPILIKPIKKGAKAAALALALASSGGDSEPS